MVAIFQMVSRRADYRDRAEHISRKDETKSEMRRRERTDIETETRRQPEMRENLIKLNTDPNGFPLPSSCF